MYPPKDVGEDGTNEIDIEIARWGHALAPQVNYTAWYRSHKGNRHDTVEVPKDLANATFDMTWQHDQVTWESPIQHGKTIDFRGDIADQPQTLIINLWLFHSPSPEDHNEVEFVIKSMRLQ
jgi:beta-glucanase (GH16 family)